MIDHLDHLVLTTHNEAAYRPQCLCQLTENTAQATGKEING